MGPPAVRTLVEKAGSGLHFVCEVGTEQYQPKRPGSFQAAYLHGRQPPRAGLLLHDSHPLADGGWLPAWWKMVKSTKERHAEKAVPVSRVLDVIQGQIIKKTKDKIKRQNCC